MAETLAPITIKDGDGVAKQMVAYNDGTYNAFGHLVLNSAGALIDPATATAQATGNASLATIAAAAGALPAGAATAAAQATGNGSLATIAAAAGALPTGAATSALQSTGNTSLATIASAAASQATATNQATGNASLATIAANAVAVPGVTPITVAGSAVAAGRSFCVKCTVAGTFTVTFSDSSSSTYPMYPGVANYPWAITNVTASTGTATFENWK